MLTEEILDSFWSRVEKLGPTDCWPWLKATDRQGRGKFWVKGSGRHYPAPRIALASVSGLWPNAEVFACHTCDNPACCNPAHLWWGDRAANMRDCGAKGRHGFQQKYRGESNPQSSLTEDAVREIRQRYSEGQSAASIAPIYGVSPQTIWKAATGRTWGHV
jgi:hypothetical protein